MDKLIGNSENHQPMDDIPPTSPFSLILLFVGFMTS